MRNRIKKLRDARRKYVVFGIGNQGAQLKNSFHPSIGLGFVLRQININLLFQYLILLVFACLLLLAYLGAYDLRDSTEPREAGVAAEMYLDGNALLPRLNGNAFLEKPPLYAWLAGVAMSAIGISPLAARIPSAVAGIIAVLCVLWGSRRRDAHRYAGLVSGLFLISMAGLWEHSSQAGQDALLATGVCLMLLGFFNAIQSSNPCTSWFVCAMGLAIATLAKGVVGLAIPGVVVFSYLVLETLFFDKRILFRKWIITAVVASVGLVPICIWLTLLYRHYGWDYFYELTWVNSVGRFVGDYTWGGHDKPFYFYLLYLPGTFQPWTILVFLGLWHHLQRVKTDRFSLFLCCWLIAPFLLLSISSGKGLVYLLAIYPAAALVAGSYFCSFMEKSKACLATTVETVLVTTQAILISILPVVLIVELYRLKEPVGVQMLIGALSLLSVVFLWREGRKKRYQAALACGLGLIALVFVSYRAVVLPSQDPEKSLRPMFDELLSQENSGKNVALFRPLERIAGAAVFYMRHTVTSLSSVDELNDYLRSEKHVALIDAAALDIEEHVRIIHRYTVDGRRYLMVSGLEK
jgi:4-amino-4-deoxy-L-arabinose transferase-like glycosyltransferase